MNHLIFAALAFSGYKKGEMFKETVFKCTKKTTNIVYVCKVNYVNNRNEVPIEAQVFNLISQNPHKTLPQMHELIHMNSYGMPKTFVEVIDYLDSQEGWMNLEDYIEKNDLNDEDRKIFIFKQIVDATLHLYNLGISHSDLKGNRNNINIRFERYDQRKQPFN
jgi:serine/threonine protein kinase